MPDSLLGGIVISEFLADPNGANNFDTDGNGNVAGGDEFVELANTSSTAIDISGLEFWDAGRDNWFTFPPGTILEAGAFAVVVRNVQSGGMLPPVTGNNLAFDADFNQNVLNNDGDNLVVYDPSNDEFIQATYNGDALDDPTATPPNTYDEFSSTATRVGSGENFGNDIDGFSIQRFPGGFLNDAGPTPGDANVCFASGTKIGTADGFLPIETLKVGDRICTRQSGPQPIRWIFSRRVRRSELMANPNLQPVTLPRFSNLRVSRQHRILISGRIAQRMFGEQEILVPAKDLVGYCGVEIDNLSTDFCYYHILLDDHHVINANGISAESLHLGRESLLAMSKDARAELDQIFPGLGCLPNFAPTTLCRSSFSGRRVRALAKRHEKNQRDFAAPF